MTAWESENKIMSQQRQQGYPNSARKVGKDHAASPEDDLLDNKSPKKMTQKKYGPSDLQMPPNLVADHGDHILETR